MESKLEIGNAIIEEGNQMLETFKEELLSDPLQKQVLPEDWEDFYPMTSIQLGMVYHNIADANLYFDQSQVTGYRRLMCDVLNVDHVDQLI